MIEDIERKLRILLYDAEININICNSIQSYLKTKQRYNDEDFFLILAANNSFCEAVSIVHTLLGVSKIGQKRELNLYTLLSNGKNDLELIQKEYQDAGFDEIRDQLVDHKDKDYTSEPELRLRQLIFTYSGLKRLEAIMLKLNSFVYSNFNRPFDPTQSPFSNIQAGLNKILKLIT